MDVGTGANSYLRTLSISIWRMQAHTLEFISMVSYMILELDRYDMEL